MTTALSSWFHQWHPHSNPHNIISPIIHQSNPDYTKPISFSSHSNFSSFFNEFPTGAKYTKLKKYRNQSNKTNILPYVLSLSLLKHPDSDYPEDANRILEKTGPFKTWYHWNVLDFAYPSEAEREKAIIFEEFIPRHNLPLGIEVYKDRLFMTMPKWKPGVPATLAVLPKVPKEPAPKLVPYPNWSWHKLGSCSGIVSVFRVQADSCGRLWVLDSGQIDITINPKQICHPKILVFDLETDELLVKYEFPAAFIKQDSLYSNILVDIRDTCENVHAYLTYVWRFGLVVFSLEKMRAWRIVDHLFFPDPLAAAYKVHHLEFEWTDGLFGLALTPWKKHQKDRILYFHPMSSFREFYVYTSVICNETGWSQVKDAFKVIGQSRGKAGHVSASGMDRNGIMYYNLVTRDTIGCWDSRKPYKRLNQGVVAKSSKTLVFPNDLKVDNEPRQSVWVISNYLPFYLYEGLNEHKINFRVMSAFTDEAIKDTICDPVVAYRNSFEEFEDGEDCY